MCEFVCVCVEVTSAAFGSFVYVSETGSGIFAGFQLSTSRRMTDWVSGHLSLMGEGELRKKLKVDKILGLGDGYSANLTTL